MGIGGECRKFAANVFNKNKCSNCYKLREQHCDEALETGKLARNISRCGFLFVAPDWDFTNPVYRTKRWQRRWFVLYDDGELTYAIDENPETIPQASVNMSCVFEITSADAITGNANSIAIVAPDGIHFIKGSCVEESRLWLDILKLFSCQSTKAALAGHGGHGYFRKKEVGVGGRAKRSATFPGIRNVGGGCKRFNAEAAAAKAEEGGAGKGQQAEDEADGPGGGDDGGDEGDDSDSSEEDSDPKQQQQQQQPQRQQQPSSVSRMASRQSLDLQQMQQQQSRFSSSSSSSSSSRMSSSYSSSVSPSRIMSSRSASSKRLLSSSSTTSLHKSADSDYCEAFDSAKVEAQLAESRLRRLNSRTWDKPGVAASAATEEVGRRMVAEANSAVAEARSMRRKESRNSWDSSSMMTLVQQKAPSPEKEEERRQRQQQPMTGDRGIPDGGSGLESAASASTASAAATSASASSSDIVDVKKGWLMKESSPSSGSWRKYWFVLQDGALVYYGDPAAESKGFLDGVVDLNNVDKIGMEELSRNYVFYLQMDNEPRKYRLSAITAGIRQKWVDAISASAHLETDSEDDDDDDEDEDNDEDDDNGDTVDDGNPEEADDHDDDDMQINITDERTKDSHEDPEVSAAAVNEPGSYYSPPVRSPKAAGALARRRTSDAILVTEKKQAVSTIPSDKKTTAVEGSATTASSLSSELESQQIQSLHKNLLVANEELDRCKEELREEAAAVGQARKAAEMAEKRAAEATLEHRIEKEKVMKLLEENSELQRSTQENLSSAEKWKSAYDATCAQLERGQQKIAYLEEENERVAAAFQDKIVAKDKIVSDLSEQLKESEERIQDLLLESEGSRRVSKEKEREHEENLGRIIMAIEDEYKDTIKMQQEQINSENVKMSKLESELYMRRNFASSAAAMMSEAAAPNSSQSTSSDSEELFARLRSSMEQVHTLKSALRESQDSSDTMELEKAALEEAFKRTIKLHEEEKGMLVDRVEDLTNKLYASEKSLRQLKERRLSRKAKLSAATAAAAAAAASGTAAAPGTAAVGPTTTNQNAPDQ